MEKRKWPWKKKSAGSSLGDSETTGSASSQCGQDSDDQFDTAKEHHNDEIQSYEVASKTEMDDEDTEVRIRNLTEKLSAALVNVAAKDDLVKQHAKVAEEAVAGWEKAENEASDLKQKLEEAADRNSVLEDRVSHLDGALKECVRQLRQMKEEHDQNINNVVTEKTRELESCKTELQNQILELQNQLEADKTKHPSSPTADLTQKIESLERENIVLRQELVLSSEELEIRTIERDLSTQAAETASKVQLESIKKVAKLEAECRRLRVMAGKASPSIHDHRSIDSHSDSGERPEASCSDSWASALIAELDQFRNGKTVKRSPPGNSSVEIDLMDDFLEMEKLAALSETEHHKNDPEMRLKQSEDMDNSLRVEIEFLICRTKELEEKLERIEAEKSELVDEAMRFNDLESSLKSILENAISDKMELEEKLESMEAEKTELQIAYDIIKDKYEASRVHLSEMEMKLVGIENEITMANESKEEVEKQLVGVEAEARTMSEKLESLEKEVRKERAFSVELKIEYDELAEELSRIRMEAEQREEDAANLEPMIKQEDMAAAAGKLTECQKTIASLGKQLEYLATLEDFLIDTRSIPAFSSGPKESRKVRSYHKFSMKNSDSSESDSSGSNTATPLVNKNNNGSSPASVSSAVSTNQGSSDKNRNGFAKFFTRSKNGIQLEI